MTQKLKRIGIVIRVASASCCCTNVYAWVDRYPPYLSRHGSAAGNTFSLDFSGQERSVRRRAEEVPTLRVLTKNVCPHTHYDTRLTSRVKKKKGGYHTISFSTILCLPTAQAAGRVHSQERFQCYARGHWVKGVL